MTRFTPACRAASNTLYVPMRLDSRMRSQRSPGPAFAPELRGKRVSGHINKVLFDELAARGHKQVKITTELDNEGANRQLQSWGFRDSHRFRFYDKDMVTYVLDLVGHPRVEPLSRHPSV